MRQRASRGGTVDGIRRESLPELGKLIGVTDCALSKYIHAHGVEFDYHGHRVVMDPPARRNTRGGFFMEPLEKVVAPKPVDSMEQVRRARRNYNERGESRRGLLMRKAY